jgi:hypothetical protein
MESNDTQLISPNFMMASYLLHTNAMKTILTVDAIPIELLNYFYVVGLFTIFWHSMVDLNIKSIIPSYYIIFESLRAFNFCLHGYGYSDSKFGHFFHFFHFPFFWSVFHSGFSPQGQAGTHNPLPLPLHTLLN